MRIPNGIQLSVKKCPECKQSLSSAPLKPNEGRVDAHCPNASCSYRVPLFWLGDAQASMN